jgi:drug/metabolite transporter (DMT)-like permease
MLPSRRVTFRVPVKTRIKGIILMAVLILMLVGFVIFETWPARPRDWIGWALALLVGVPLMLLGEYAAEALTKRAPADPGRRVSIKRIAWLLMVVLGFGCIVVAGLRVQARLLGNPVAELGRLIGPHYH